MVPNGEDEHTCIDADAHIYSKPFQLLRKARIVVDAVFQMRVCYYCYRCQVVPLTDICNHRCPHNVLVATL